MKKLTINLKPLTAGLLKIKTGLTSSAKTPEEYKSIEDYFNKTYR